MAEKLDPKEAVPLRRIYSKGLALRKAKLTEF
jgi:hypothetical protein